MRAARGFSLIELMVVIAIVAVLAAVAVPEYKIYMTKARLATTVTIVDDLINRSIQYANVHGRFANAYDLGLSEVVGWAGVTDPTLLSPYFANPLPGESFTIGDESYNSTSAGSQYCGALLHIVGLFNAAAFGLPPSIDQTLKDLYGYAGAGSLDCYIFHENGTFKKYCFYYYFAPSDPNYISRTKYGTDLLIPGWFNGCITSDCSDSSPQYVEMLQRLETSVTCL